MSVDDVSAIGAYGMPMRFNITESMMLVTNAGAAYDFGHYRARTRNVFVNKPLIGMFRGVGIPLSTIVSEVLADRAASKLGMDPLAFKRLNYRKKENMPCVTPAGSKLDDISFDACLDRLVDVMNYNRLRAEQAELRKRGIYRGVGVATFVEPTAYGPVFYGPTGAAISVQDGCTIRLEPTGMLRCVTSITDQGQGTLHSLAQIIADTVSVDVDAIDMMAGDSAISTYGGGAWASRGIAIGGEAADMHVEQIETPERSTDLGAKGVGELGLTGAMGALWVAVNDALRPLGATIAQQPFTPERVLEAIASATERPA